MDAGARPKTGTQHFTQPGEPQPPGETTGETRISPESSMQLSVWYREDSRPSDWRCFKTCFPPEECLKWKYVMYSKLMCARVRKEFEGEKIIVNESKVNIGKPVGNKEMAESVCLRVFSYAVLDVGKDLLVEFYDIGKDLFQPFQKYAENAAQNIAQMLYICMVEEAKMSVTYPTDYTENVKSLIHNFLQSHNAGSQKFGQTQVHAEDELDQAWHVEYLEVDDVFQKIFCKGNLKKHIQQKYPETKIDVKIDKDNGKVKFTLTGVESEIFKAKEILLHYKKHVVHRKIVFVTQVKKFLYECNVEKVIQGILDAQNLGCVVEQVGAELTLYGFDDEVLRIAAIEAASHVSYNTVLVTGEWRKVINQFRKNVLEIIKGELVCVSIEDGARLGIFGLKDSVAKAVNCAKDLQKGEPIKLEVTTLTVTIVNPHIWLLMELFLNELNGKYKAEIHWGRKGTDKFEIRINGEESEKVKHEIKEYEKKIETVKKTIKDPEKHMVYFIKDKTGQAFVKEVETKCHVQINQNVRPGQDDIDEQDLPEMGIKGIQVEDGVRWLLPTRLKLFVKRKHVGSFPVNVAVTLELREHGKKMISDPIKKQDGIAVHVGVPAWKDGKNDEIRTFEENIWRALTKTVEDKEESIALPLDPIKSWPRLLFIECLVKPIIKFLTSREIQHGPLVVLLCSGDEDTVRKAANCIDENLQAAEEVHLPSKPGYSQESLTVKIVKGVLHETQADVLVNTTSPNLNLSYGRVSNSILKAAGPEIQDECFERFSNGIKPREIAETRGYKLKCKQVYHGTLRSYLKHDQTRCIMDIREFMMACLRTADDHGHKSIAFPAIGSGILRYPSDIVASEMFNAIERIKQEREVKYLREVLFVIYQKDDAILQKFTEVKESLGKPPIPPERHGPRSITFFISGTKGNIDMAICCLEAKFDGLRSPYPRMKILPESSNEGRQRENHMSRTCQKLPTDLDPFLKTKEVEPKTDVTVNNDITQTVILSRRTDYAALKHFHQAVFEKWRGKGLTFKCIGTNLEFRGMRCFVKEAAAEVENCIESLRSMYYVCHKAADGHIEIQDMIDNINANPTELKCFFDKVNGLIEIYGKSKEKVDEALTLVPEKICPGITRAREKTKPAEENAMKSMDGGKRELATCKVQNLEVKIYDGEHITGSAKCLVILDTNLSKDSNAIDIGVASGGSVNKQIHPGRKTDQHDLGYIEITKDDSRKYEYILRVACPSRLEYHPDADDQSNRQYEEDLYRIFVKIFIQADNLQQSSLVILVSVEVSSLAFAEPFVKALKDPQIQMKYLNEVHFVCSERSLVECISEKLREISESLLYKRKSKQFDELDTETENKSSMETLPKDPRKAVKNTGRSRPVKLHVSQENKPPNCKAIMEKITNLPQPIFSPCFVEDLGKGMIDCSFTRDFNVQIYTADIVQLTGIDAVVCSEDQSGQAAGMIAKKLLDSGGNDYKDEKKKKFKDPPELGEVVTTAGGKNSFKLIIHALIPKRDETSLTNLYCKTFQEAAKLRINSVAMSLLATGIGREDPVNAAKILFTSCVQFSHGYQGCHLTLHVINNDKKKTEHVYTCFKEFINKFSLGFSGLATNGTNTGTVEPRTSLMKAEFKVQISDTNEAFEEEQTEEGLDEPNCVICMDEFDQPETLRCGHTYCTGCIEQHFLVKKTCPTCGEVCGVIEGDQPDGEMEISKLHMTLPGFKEPRALTVSYMFNDGHQGPNHPRPGAYYPGIRRTAYLPDNDEGRRICAMLQVAFKRRLVFTIGTSRTTGQEGVITWNDIHHKTNYKPNTTFGYPDPTYLSRVREELAAKGITEKDIKQDLLAQISSDSIRLRFALSSR